MRQIILDTETTGLEWKKGNRVVEIGCVELLERRPTGRTYHQYINPQREFEQGAAEVTGLSLEFLSDKPLFADIADEFLAFIEGAELVIHNAAFDVGFLDYELSRLGERYGRLADRVTVEDSLLMARQRFPGQRNSLDALCKRLGVDNTHRQLHGALLDAQLLCDVYLNLTAGQSEIGFGGAEETAAGASVAAVIAFDTSSTGQRPRVAVTDEELAAHEARLEKLRKKAGGRCLWDPPALEQAGA
ncbi:MULTISPECIES: DNA polymerase III subunit epsilon [unclassified Pseudoxanthomonas]|uniref:DNA polymerase III subunit epsilon n=1 Tax=unclassified Pseudoxanthomonas TaxID=2645906 RepID=UPI0008F0A0FC|nr:MULTISPECIES: DNA polymerase III subunit epsilon [unclassified Pseudoxanthomonas]PPJ42307.1 DNA polymerase III subunit epsilon [Pseudoxanthomonas sp. KAs_5_3]SFV27816.1 DNA polymerase-3 subunit epsilon [Pseudoxanthomonas sp. YR558]